MKHVVCEQCGKNVPLNETFMAFGRGLCQPCTEEDFARHDQLEFKDDSVVRRHDPTICVECGKDHGSEELPLLMKLPVCEECGFKYRHRPYPGWLKASFIGLLVLLAVACARNYRFFAAYVEMRQSQRAFAEHDLDKAAALMTQASGHVPENRELESMASLYAGLHLLMNDRATEAVPLLQKARNLVRNNPGLERLLDSAEAGAAFEEKDYDKFLAKALEITKKAGADWQAIAQVASAYACKYAVTGDELFKKQSLEFLDKAGKQIGADHPDFKEYESRIRHRLQSREIISRREYNKRFPGGG